MSGFVWGEPELVGSGTLVDEHEGYCVLECSYRPSSPSNYFRITGTWTIPCCSYFNLDFEYIVQDVCTAINTDEIGYTAIGDGYSSSYFFPAIYSPDSKSKSVNEYIWPPRDITVTMTLALCYGNTHSGTNTAKLTSIGWSSYPIAPTLSNLSPTTTTVNTATQFTVTTSTVCPQVTYQWNFGDGGTSTSAPPVSHTYTNAGAYQLTVTASNTAGTNSLTETIGVRGLPTATISPQNKIVLIDSKVNFTSAGSSIGYPPYSPSADLAYQWTCVNSSSQQTGFTYVDGTSSTSEEPHIQFTTLDTYTVSLVVTNGYGSSPSVSTSVYVVEKEPPTDEQMRDDIIIITTDAQVTKRFEDV